MLQIAGNFSKRAVSQRRLIDVCLEAGLKSVVPLPSASNMPASHPFLGR